MDAEDLDALLERAGQAWHDMIILTFREVLDLDEP